MSHLNTQGETINSRTNAGQLFYVMGASGAGKDSVINYAKKHLSTMQPIVFSHRYITRPNTTGAENHIALTPSQFKLRRRHHCFTLHWQSHKTYYAIGTEVNHWMANGLSVVINGSREHLKSAIKRYPTLIPILIEVDRDILIQRLTVRGRESAQDIKKRMAHSHTFTHYYPANTLTLFNNGSLKDAGNRFINTLLLQCGIL